MGEAGVVVYYNKMFSMYLHFVWTSGNKYDFYFRVIQSSIKINNSQSHSLVRNISVSHYLLRVVSFGFISESWEAVPLVTANV